jgi:hypothetical protein
MASFRRVTMSLPAEVASNLRSVSKRLGVSNSALVSLLLAEPLAELAKLLAVSSPRGRRATQAERRRLRGASIELIQKVVSEAIEAAADVGGKLPL